MKRLRIHLLSHFVTFICAAGCGLSGYSRDHITKHRRRSRSAPCNQSTQVYVADEANFNRMIEETKVLPRGRTFPALRPIETGADPTPSKEPACQTTTARKSRTSSSTPKKRKASVRDDQPGPSSTADLLTTTDRLIVKVNRLPDAERSVEVDEPRMEPQDIRVLNKEVPTRITFAPNEKDQRERDDHASGAPAKKKAKRRHREPTTVDGEKPGPSRQLTRGERSRNRRRMRTLRRADSLMTDVRRLLEQSRRSSDEEQEEEHEKVVDLMKGLLADAMLEFPPRKPRG